MQMLPQEQSVLVLLYDIYADNYGLAKSSLSLGVPDVLRRERGRCPPTISSSTASTMSEVSCKQLLAQ